MHQPPAEHVHWLFATGFLLLGVCLLARAIVGEAPSMGIEVRAGMHTGEVELIGEDVGGIAVHVAARIAALAEGRSVLVSRTVRDLVTGSGIEFDPFGRHSLKGVAEEWDVYTVTGTPLSASSPD